MCHFGRRTRVEYFWFQNRLCRVGTVGLLPNNLGAFFRPSNADTPFSFGKVIQLTRRGLGWSKTNGNLVRWTSPRFFVSSACSGRILLEATVCNSINQISIFVSVLVLIVSLGK